MNRESTGVALDTEESTIGPVHLVPLGDLDVSSYTVTDPFFGRPYLDTDALRERPSPHRVVHGGFSGTDTRFAFYFTAAGSYRRRMFQPLGGVHGGHEVTYGDGMLGEMLQRDRAERAARWLHAAAEPAPGCRNGGRLHLAAGADPRNQVADPPCTARTPRSCQRLATT
jgi:hypothetical protein